MTQASLTQLFEAPDEHIGAFAWLCGYSADALFLNGAAERFTQATAGRRAQEGRVSFALMADPGQPALSMLDLPGVAHLPVLRPEALPFVLLHAKVALLGFRRTDSKPSWRLRLIVSTGNWTVETLEDSLDLAWRVEVDSSELGNPDEDVKQRCADIDAAAGLLAWMRQFFDCRLLSAPVSGRAGPTAAAIAKMDEWIAACRPLAGDARPRFFDNRAAGLLQQLPRMIREQAAGVRRNQLVMGSGFYEGPVLPNRKASGAAQVCAVPSVLDGIVRRLQEENLLTQSAEISLVVNEDRCQAVAGALQAIRDRQWKVYPPGRPAVLFGPDSRRMLHAKFLLGGNWQAGSPRCKSAWIYLGSGNLTRPGFLLKAARGMGNLEAGVVFDPGELGWEDDAQRPEVPVITSVLPVQFDEPLALDATVSAGQELPERPSAHVAAPVAWLQWLQESGQGFLVAIDAAPVLVDIIDVDGLRCLRDGDRWLWKGDCPRQACIRWGEEGHQALVPVQDAFGRMAPLPLASLQLDEVGRLLEAFPAIAAADDGDDELDDDPSTNDDPAGRQQQSPRTSTRAYAVRAVLAQVEAIAAKQTAIGAEDWNAWCLRLEQVLTQAAQSVDVAAFRSLALNPLGPLRAGPFRPDFAVDSASDAGRCYEAALDRVERAWLVQALTPLGSLQ